MIILIYSFFGEENKKDEWPSPKRGHSFLKKVLIPSTAIVVIIIAIIDRCQTNKQHSVYCMMYTGNSPLTRESVCLLIIDVIKKEVLHKWRIVLNELRISNEI